MDFREKIISDLIKDGVDVTPNSIIDDLFIRKYLEMNEPIDQKIEEVKKRQFFEEFMNLKDEDKKLFAGNFFVEVAGGEKAEGAVRLLFDEPQDSFVQNETIFSTDKELNFLSKGNFSITAEEMANNISGMYYFQEITVEAEGVGEEYNVEPLEIKNCDDQNILNKTIRIENPFHFQGGENEESFEQLYNRIPKALSARVMANTPGINSILKNEFKTSIDKIYPVRTGHQYMKRDIVIIDDNEYRVGNLFDLWIKSNKLNSYATIINKNDSQTVPFGFSFSDFYEGEENYSVIDVDNDPVDKVVFLIKEIRAISLDGTVSEPINFIYKQKEGYENSVKQQSTIEIIDQEWKNTSTQLQIEYYSTPLISKIQTFVLEDQIRMPVGDPLIKHFELKKIYGIINYKDDGENLEEDHAQEELNDFLSKYTNKKTTLKISDIVSKMYDLGAIKVQMPLKLYIDKGSKIHSEFFTSAHDQFVNLTNKKILSNTVKINKEIEIVEEIIPSPIDESISLDRENIIPNSLEIEDLIVDEDYEIDYENGIVNMIEDGNTEEGKTYSISYNIFPQEGIEYELDYEEGKIKIFSNGLLNDNSNYEINYGYNETEAIEDQYEFLPFETIISNLTLNKV